MDARICHDCMRICRWNFSKKKLAVRIEKRAPQSKLQREKKIENFSWKEKIRISKFMN